MPRSRRQRRLPTDFSAIDKGERVRWSLGLVVVENEFTPTGYHEGPTITPWPSWAEWAASYALCRPAFLTWYAMRHPDETPGAELLFAAYQKGENPGAVMIPQPPDPRRILMGKPLTSM